MPITFVVRTIRYTITLTTKKKKKKKERNVLIRIDFSKNSLENNRITTLLNSFTKILATITIIK